MMEYRRLGDSGLKISALSFGSWVTFDTQMQIEAARKCMVAAYDAGVNFFDNAEGYADGKSELIMGDVFKKTGWRRDSYIVSSKVFFGSIKERKPTQIGLSRKHVVEACHQAIDRLQSDYLDLYYCHRPDADTPIEEVVWTMTALIQQGKVMYWGTSEWSAQQIMQAYSVARERNLIPPTMEQPHYNMLHRKRFEVEYDRLYSEIGLGTTIFSPLASGLLTGKYNDGIPKDSRLSLAPFQPFVEELNGEEWKNRFEMIRQIGTVADELGVPMARLALAWCLKNTHVSSVITGASREAQVIENMKAVDDVVLLTNDVMARIDSILKTVPEI